MSVKVRLQRRGKKGSAIYRLVAADSRKPRSGVVLEILGQYDPNQEPALLNYKQDRLLHWFSNGAIATDPVLRLFLDKKAVLPEKQLAAYKRRIEHKKNLILLKKKADEKAKKAADAEAKKEADAAAAKDEAAEAPKTETSEVNTSDMVETKKSEASEPKKSEAKVAKSDEDVAK
ncbi:MAG: 30S ribosomal protein S16 [bacterium]